MVRVNSTGLVTVNKMGSHKTFNTGVKLLYEGENNVVEYVFRLQSYFV